jgi:hypothetical protein
MASQPIGAPITGTQVVPTEPPRDRPVPSTPPARRGRDRVEPDHATPEAPAQAQAAPAADGRPVEARDSGSVLTSQPSLALDAREVVVSLVSLVAWLGLLMAGITVGTQPYIDGIRNLTTHGFWEVSGSLLVILLCHTVSNVALLCCLAAFLGVIASRAVGRPNTNVQTPPERMGVYVAAVTRGFFVFLVIQSGSILLSDQAFTNLTLERYVRLAGLSSLFSFAIGYNPRLFGELLDRVNSTITGATNDPRATRQG